ncbi:hypothetical protein QBC36DRAFT_196589 [Triangularia setosa]|uniref:Uncharacterized protein n=1 Tax=Triangularia setosa TaxID=2587417 RepID=A0AAN6VZH3_9PEZI|nr:hypothetical protein QBC36DRAFT_196589 [Podospora setosa]
MGWTILRPVAFERVTGKPVPTTWGLLGQRPRPRVKELGSMVEWFAEEGIKQICRRSSRSIQRRWAWRSDSERALLSRGSEQRREE